MAHIEEAFGEAAGEIYQLLNLNGAMSKTQIAKSTKLSNNLVNQGIGWLAREGKLKTEKTRRVELIKLKD
ncbi:MAG: winged helix-turn-helix domain-containing protein [Candidatus Hydrogenedentota bacterium]|nr:MAG: winged helix-turn-helix domain-containing protein [Candidatus Hydrogenedentota bacterium]